MSIKSTLFSTNFYADSVILKQSIKDRIDRLHLIKNHDLDDLTFDIETIYRESGYRRFSHDQEIKDWIRTTKVYSELFSVKEQAEHGLINSVSKVWEIILNGIK